VARVSDTDKIIGNRLKTARQAAKLSQTALAKAIDASFQQIQKYERGSNRINPAALLGFAKALDLPITYFFEGLEGNSRKNKHPQDRSAKAFRSFSKSKQAEVLLRKYHNLRLPEERKLVHDLLDVLR
jgi:transcriptional regulator with XRE-family HTH domain